MGSDAGGGRIVSQGILSPPLHNIEHSNFADRRCCRTLTVEDSERESMRLDRHHEQAGTRPLPHDELVQLHCFSSQTRVAVDRFGQGDDLARAA